MSNLKGEGSGWRMYVKCKYYRSLNPTAVSRIEAPLRIGVKLLFFLGFPNKYGNRS